MFVMSLLLIFLIPSSFGASGGVCFVIVAFTVYLHLNLCIVNVAS